MVALDDFGGCVDKKRIWLVCQVIVENIALLLERSLNR